MQFQTGIVEWAKYNIRFDFPAETEFQRKMAYVYKMYTTLTNENS